MLATWSSTMRATVSAALPASGVDGQHERSGQSGARAGRAARMMSTAQPRAAAVRIDIDPSLGPSKL